MPTSRVIELIAPSGYPHDMAAVARGVALLESQGHKVINKAAAERRYLRFAGTEDERAAEINHLADARHPLPDIVLAVRGGYGAAQILQSLDYEALHRRLAGSPVILAGHSDFTALQMALLAQAHIITFAGPVLTYDFGAEAPSAFTMEHFWRTITTPSVMVQWETKPAPQMSTDMQGTLWGGNLAMLCSLLGTPYFPVIDDGILFVEDVNEHPFRVERMLYQLHLAGVLGRQRSLVLGDFTNYKLTEYDNGYDFDTMVAHMRTVTDIPIVTGLPFGHCPDKLTLPVGGRARLRTGGGVAELVLSGYPCLRA